MSAPVLQSNLLLYCRELFIFVAVFAITEYVLITGFNSQKIPLVIKAISFTIESSILQNRLINGPYSISDMKAHFLHMFYLIVNRFPKINSQQIKELSIINGRINEQVNMTLENDYHIE